MGENQGIAHACQRIADSARFHAVVVGVILLNAVLVGLETHRGWAAANASLFSAANAAILALFVAELLVRLAAVGFRIDRFLRDGWNAFDFAVVALSLVPGVGPFATVARIARVLRVVRLVSVSPKLRLIVGTMMRSIPSLGHVTFLLSLLLYVYAVMGVNLFRDHDPANWGSLGRALVTLFQILTLEGWIEVQEASMSAGSWSFMYYASFVIIAVFVVVNLFIAVVLNNLDELREEDRLAALEAAERERALHDPLGFADHLAAVRGELERLEGIYRKQTEARQRGE